MTFHDRVRHLVIVEAFLGRQLYAPAQLELSAYLVVVNVLIAGILIRHGTEVARALYVVMPAQRICARAGPHVISG